MAEGTGCKEGETLICRKDFLSCQNAVLLWKSPVPYWGNARLLALQQTHLVRLQEIGGLLGLHQQSWVSSQWDVKYINSWYAPELELKNWKKLFVNDLLDAVVPIIYIVLYWRSMFPWSAIEGNTFLNILGCAHIAASISPWLGSVIYHLFMNYNKGGESFYQLLLQIDMFGIWITECFGELSK
jgi:hypothetical protein